MTVTIKLRAHELIEGLPDDATSQDLLYAVELRTDIEAGFVDAKAGRPVGSPKLWSCAGTTGCADEASDKLSVREAV